MAPFSILGGNFTTGTTGRYDMLEDRADSPVAAVTIFGGFFGDQTPIDQYNVCIQDDIAFPAEVERRHSLRPLYGL